MVPPCIGDGLPIEHQRTAVGRLERAGVGHRRGGDHQCPAIRLYQAGIVDRAGIDGQRAAGRLKRAGSGDGDGRVADGAGAGGIQKPVDVHDAARDRGGLQFERRAAIHLHRAGVGDRLRAARAVERERAVVVANSSPLLVTEVASRVSVPPLASSKPELLIELGSMVSVPPVASSVPVAAMVMVASPMALVPVEFKTP